MTAKWSLGGSPTATAPYCGTCDDGLDYVIKRDGTWPIRASELIASMLAEECSIAVPPYRIIEEIDGELVFGSQILGDTTSSLSAMLANDPPDPAVPGQASRIAALDLFVGNVDRHLGNYLVRAQNLRMRLFAMDFSHCLFASSSIPALPLPASCKTVQRGRDLRRRWGFVLSEALDCAERIENLPSDYADRLLSRVPVDWLSPLTRAAFSDWWKIERQGRINAIQSGLADASLL